MDSTTARDSTPLDTAIPAAAENTLHARLRKIGIKLLQKTLHVRIAQFFHLSFDEQVMQMVDRLGLQDNLIRVVPHQLNEHFILKVRAIGQSENFAIG